MSPILVPLVPMTGTGRAPLPLEAAACPTCRRPTGCPMTRPTHCAVCPTRRRRAMTCPTSRGLPLPLPLEAAAAAASALPLEERWQIALWLRPGLPPGGPPAALDAPPPASPPKLAAPAAAAACFPGLHRCWKAATLVPPASRARADPPSCATLVQTRAASRAQPACDSLVPCPQPAQFSCAQFSCASRPRRVLRPRRSSASASMAAAAATSAAVVATSAAES